MKENTKSAQWFEIGKEYLARGWSIFPLNSNKKPIVKHWKPYQKQKVTHEQLEKWCQKESLGGFAVVTGELSGLFVLDVDGGSKFDTSILPKTPCVKTGSGAKQLYFIYPPNSNLRNRAGFEFKTDTRGEGGYAVLPYSKHPSGGTYTWIVDINTTPLAEIPTSLLDKLSKTTRSNAPLATGGNIFGGVSESRRNDSATRVIGKLFSQFNKRDWDTEVWELVRAWNSSNKPPLNEQELLITFNSIKNIALSEKKDKRGTQAQQVIDYVLQENTDIFLNQFKEPCLIYPENSFIAQKINSKKTAQLLSKLYWDKKHKPVSARAVKEATVTLQGIATFDKKETKEVHNRIAWHDEDLYYDLGDNEHVVHITKEGWAVKTTSPVLFQRFNHQKIQVIPQRGGKLEDFVKLVNISGQNNILLLLTSLVVSFIPDIPRPILAINGDPGSAKSTLLREMRDLIDPSVVPLSTPPKKASGLAQLASHNYVTYFDNLSYISGELSDFLCRLVTGDGFSKRELYSDDEDVLYSYKRVVGMCGINQVATKGDLLDRCVIITLDLIDNKKRKEEKLVWREFNEQKPKILGSIFDCLSYCLKTAPSLKIDSAPRMMDAFRYATAASQFLGYKENNLEKAFSLNKINQNEEAIEASPIAQVVLEFMNGKKIWDGTSTELYEELLEVAEKLKIKSRFPKAPSWIWKKINVVRSNLLIYGIRAEKYREGRGNKIRLTNSQIDNGSMEALEADF